MCQVLLKVPFLPQTRLDTTKSVILDKIFLGNIRSSFLYKIRGKKKINYLNGVRTCQNWNIIETFHSCRFGSDRFWMMWPDQNLVTGYNWHFSLTGNIRNTVVAACLTRRVVTVWVDGWERRAAGICGLWFLQQQKTNECTALSPLVPNKARFHFVGTDWQTFANVF